MTAQKIQRACTTVGYTGCGTAVASGLASSPEQVMQQVELHLTCFGYPISEIGVVVGMIVGVVGLLISAGLNWWNKREMQRLARAALDQGRLTVGVGDE